MNLIILLTNWINLFILKVDWSLDTESIDIITLQCIPELAFLSLKNKIARVKDHIDQAVIYLIDYLLISCTHFVVGDT